MIDIGVNIQHPFYLDDLEQFIQDFSQAGVKKLICISSDLGETRLNQQLCEQNQQLYFTAGVHPHQAKTWHQESISSLEQLLQSPKCLAVGEMGLDFDRNYSTPEQQITALEAQLAIAKETNKPVYLHERKAFTELTARLRDTNLAGVIHCFTGDQEQLATYLDLGLFVGITGWLLDERRNSELVEALNYLPLDRILLETDAPYLTPRNIRPRPKRNHPKYLPVIAQAIAAQKGVDLEQLIQQTNKNNADLFGISD